MKKNILSIGLFLALTHIGLSQTSTKKADGNYSAFDYDDAIKRYEFIQDRDINAQRSLAKSYSMVDNYAKAEEAYAKLVSMPGATADDTYSYAQALLENQKYAEAQVQIDKFESMAPSDKRAMEYGQAGNFIEKILSIKNDVKITNLDINTPQQDFGTAFYKETEVVYAATSKVKGLTMRKWSGNNLSYLDMVKATRELGKGPLSGRKKLKANKKHHEGPASFNDAGDFMAFTRNDYKAKSQSGTVTLELCTSKLVDGKWTKAEIVPFNTKEYSFGHPALTPDGKTMYFASDMPGGKGGVDIYRVDRVGESWGTPVNLQNINTEGNEMFPYYHRDGILFFASNGHPGLGGLDIFATKLTDLIPAGSVRNVGAPLNTNKDDFALIVDKEQKIGYLSSNREGGKGDDDIYSVEFTKPFKFGKTIKGEAKDKEGNILANTVVNLYNPQGKVVSTTTTSDNGAYSFEVDDLGTYSLNGNKEKYFDGKNTAPVVEDKDITVADVILEKDPGMALKMIVTDSKTKQPLDGVKYKITNTQTGEVFMQDVTPVTGDAMKPLADMKVNDLLAYKIELVKEGYFPKTVSFNQKISKPGIINVHEALDLGLDKEVKDLRDLVVINDIRFDLNKFIIRPDAAIELDKVVEVMNKYPGMEVELGSHTDCRASKKYNETLSDKRAKASAAYIKSKITNPARIYGKGYGEAVLLNGCACEGAVKSTCSEEEHQKNRRTEFRIISMGAGTDKVDVKNNSTNSFDKKGK